MVIFELLVNETDAKCELGSKARALVPVACTAFHVNFSQFSNWLAIKSVPVSAIELKLSPISSSVAAVSETATVTPVKSGVGAYLSIT